MDIKKRTLVFSLLFMGLGHIIVLKQRAKGILFALCQVVFIVFIPTIIRNLHGLYTLGVPMPDVPLRQRENSLFMMMDGVLTLAFMVLFIGIYAVSVRSALAGAKEFETTGKLPITKGIRDTLATGAFPVVALVPTVLLILFFVVVPLVFAALVAFTNYSGPHHIPPANTFDWVGLDNFQYMFGGDALWTGALGRVVVWTIVWAALATFTCYTGGFIMANIMNAANVKVAPFFRAILILPYAVPGMVSLLVWREMLNGTFGVINRTILHLGILSAGIPWLSNVNWARFTMVAINMWLGFPYFMLLITGTMTAIGQDLFEAAKIDGASSLQILRRITLPLVIYQTAPLIIMSFTHNINNFGAVFFLTGGGPGMVDTTITSAGGTEIMVTWIFNLTINLQQFHRASALAVMVFVALAPFAIFNFMRTKSFKEGEV